MRARASSAEMPICFMLRTMALTSFSKPCADFFDLAVVDSDITLGAAAGFDDAFFFEIAVGLLYGVGVDADEGGENPPRRHLVVILYGAGSDLPLHVIDNLQIDRAAVFNTKLFK